MCGISGFSLKNNIISNGKRAILASNLARLNDKRGGHSWGMIGLKNNQAHVKKGLGDMANFAYELDGYDMLLLHTRWATHGAKTIENAHPFEFGHVIGAHNGILSNHAELNARHNRKFEVDSMHIFAHLSEGLELDDIQGYGSIEWIDKNDPHKIHLARLRNGDLSIYGIGTGPENVKGVIWSSDEDHILEAMHCAGIKEYFEYEVKTGSVYYVQNGALYFMNWKLNFSKDENNFRSWRDYEWPSDMTAVEKAEIEAELEDMNAYGVIDPSEEQVIEEMDEDDVEDLDFNEELSKFKERLKDKDMTDTDTWNNFVEEYERLERLDKERENSENIFADPYTKRHSYFK